jgi:hypothetical protein
VALGPARARPLEGFFEAVHAPQRTGTVVAPPPPGRF